MLKYCEVFEEPLGCACIFDRSSLTRKSTEIEKITAFWESFNNIYLSEGPLYYPSTKHDITLVEHCGLSGCHRDLRLIENDFNHVFFIRRNGRGSFPVLKADFYFCPDGFFKPSNRYIYRIPTASPYVCQFIIRGYNNSFLHGNFNEEYIFRKRIYLDTYFYIFTRDSDSRDYLYFCIQYS